MLERILIPLDGSAAAEAILQKLRAVLRRQDSEIILFRADGTQGAREKAEAYVEERAHALAAEGIRARSLVRDGPAPEGILQAAADLKAGMIAMTTHGRGGLPRLLAGSVAEHVMRRADVPVLLVRSFSMGERPASGEELAFRRILLAVNGSEFALEVLASLREFALLFQSQVLILNVLESDKTYEPAASQVREAYEELRHQGVPVEPVLRRGDPASEILAACRTHEVDLIAMATRGRSGIARLALGSVTESVLRCSEVPLLVVRGPLRA